MFLELIDDLPPPKLSRRQGVAYSPEFSRICALPRRTWTDEQAETLAETLTSALSKPGNVRKLRPVQAVALREVHYCRGGVVPLRVGGGKTLIALLSFTVLRSKRPILIVPAKLKTKPAHISNPNRWGKAERDIREWSKHFRILPNIRVESYEKMGRVSGAEILEEYQPDVIVLDEAHKIKNKRAAVTKRMLRYLDEHPDTVLVAMTGTFTKRSLKEYAHIAAHALGDGSPLPRRYNELEQWSAALDEKVNAVSRVAPGALYDLCTEEERADPDTLAAARAGFQRRFSETPGIITTRDQRIGCSLYVEDLVLASPDPPIDEAFRKLRTTWETPDGWAFSEAVQLWQHARQLALGCYYRWDPRPEEAWLNARREWAAICRQILSNNQQRLDSELQVTRAVANGYGDRLGAPDALAAWRAIKGEFTPNTEVVWLSDGVCQQIASWMSEGPGIVWVEHRALGAKLSELTGRPYFANRGLDSRSNYIANQDGRSSIIASVASNAEGRDLQMFDRNLISSPMPNGMQWEQVIGRTHRDGQLSDEVTFTAIVSCIEHGFALEQAKKDSRYMQDTSGSEYKLCYADLNLTPLEVLAEKPGFRWVR